MILLCVVVSCQRSQKIGLLNTQGKVNSLFQNIESSKEKPLVRKNNLESLAVGRNRQEIERLMGPPEGKSLDGGNGYLWDYRRAVFDESSEKVFTWSLVSFKFLQGRCAYVNFQLEDLPPELLKEQHQGFRKSPEGNFNSTE